jgi:tRNA G10  N-methylase Trm11
MKFIIKFAQFHINFRIPELEAVAKIEKINLSFDLASYDPLVIKFKSNLVLFIYLFLESLLNS